MNTMIGSLNQLLTAMLFIMLIGQMFENIKKCSLKTQRVYVWGKYLWLVECSLKRLPKCRDIHLSLTANLTALLQKLYIVKKCLANISDDIFSTTSTTSALKSINFGSTVRYTLQK